LWFSLDFGKWSNNTKFLWQLFLEHWLSDYLFFLLYYFGLTNKFLGLISFFGRNNTIYIKYLTRFPFFSAVGISLLTIGFIFIFFINKLLKYKLLYLYTLVVFSLVFFVYIGDRYSSFVYISHVLSITILLTLFSFFLVSRLYPKTIRILFVGILLFFVGSTFYHAIDKLYFNQTNYGKLSVAYRTIVDNYNPDNEVIFAQYLRKYYLREMKGEFNYISMLNARKYKYETFLEDVQKYDAGWITWETRKSYHINNSILSYIDKNFTKHHGKNMDNLGVEVYYFDKSMIRAVN